MPPGARRAANFKSLTWPTFTPAFNYALQANHSDGNVEQDIELSLEEFNALKGCLARIRGLAA